MTVVKVCGVKELAPMLAAAEAGADMVGVNFVPGVRRRIEPATAQAMVARFRASSPRRVTVVGLFADQPADEVLRIADEVGVDWVQLCGHEGPDVWRQVGLPFLKSVHIPDMPDDAASRQEALLRLDERLHEVAEAGGLPLLDRASSRQPGGMGQTFDWTVARDLAGRGRRFLLAGGLTPDNVAAAVDAVRPYGVDVSSGVETDGVKDAAKIRAFVSAARGALSPR